MTFSSVLCLFEGAFWAWLNKEGFLKILKTNFNLDNKSFGIPGIKPLCLKVNFCCDEEYNFFLIDKYYLYYLLLIENYMYHVW